MSRRLTPFSRCLLKFLVRRGSIHAWKFDVIQSKIDTELRAMVDQVIHNRAAHDTRSRRCHDRLPGVFEGPDLLPVFVGGGLNPRPCGCYVVIEFLQQLRLRSGEFRFEIGLQFQNFLVERECGPVRAVRRRVWRAGPSSWTSDAVGNRTFRRARSASNFRVFFISSSNSGKSVSLNGIFSLLKQTITAIADRFGPQ